MSWIILPITNVTYFKSSRFFNHRSPATRARIQFIRLNNFHCLFQYSIPSTGRNIVRGAPSAAREPKVLVTTSYISTSPFSRVFISASAGGFVKKLCADSTYCLAFCNSGNSALCFVQCPNAFSTADFDFVDDQNGAFAKALVSSAIFALAPPGVRKFSPRSKTLAILASSELSARLKCWSTLLTVVV